MSGGPGPAPEVGTPCLGTMSGVTGSGGGGGLAQDRVSALLQELALMTSVVSRAAILDIKQDMMDASTIEVQGQLARIQKQMMALLHQFQLTENLVQATQSSKKSQAVTLHVLQVIANATSFARTLVSSASNNPRSTR